MDEHMWHLTVDYSIQLHKEIRELQQTYVGRDRTFLKTDLMVGLGNKERKLG